MTETLIPPRLPALDTAPRLDLRRQLQHLGLAETSTCELEQLRSTLAQLPPCVSDTTLALLPLALQQPEALQQCLHGSDVPKAWAHSEPLLQQLQQCGAHPERTLGGLQRDCVRLRQLHTLFSAWAQDLDRLRPQLPPPLQASCYPSVRGLQALLTLLELMQPLAPELRPHRHPCFLSPQMGPLLRQLHTQRQALVPLHAQLHTVFDLSDLPSVEYLQQLQQQLGAHRALLPFSRQKRRALRALHDLALPKARRLRRLQHHLPRLIEYAQRCEQMQQSAREHQAPELPIHGVRTPLARYRSLYHWHRMLRHQYGLKSPEQPCLARALCQLPSPQWRQLASWQSQASDIRTALSRYKTLTARFPALALAKDQRQRLDSRSSPLPTLLKQLEPLLARCQKQGLPMDQSLREIAQHLHPKPAPKRDPQRPQTVAYLPHAKRAPKPDARKEDWAQCAQKSLAIADTLRTCAPLKAYCSQSLDQAQYHALRQLAERH